MNEQMRDALVSAGMDPDAEILRDVYMLPSQRAALDRVLADARRYRFLAAIPDDDAMPEWEQAYEAIGNAWTKEAIDAAVDTAIDAAIATQEQP